ncbi:MAG: DUF1801 domain-containing protein [Cyclobacteriaceae bacterium]
MAELKTKPNDASVEQFIDSIESEVKRDDCRELLNLLSRITGEKPKMWGASIVGFGEYHYKYKSGREGDWFLSGFSPRKQNLTIYMMGGYGNGAEQLLAQIGKHKRSVGCLYVKKLADIDIELLEKLLIMSVNKLKSTYKDIK